MCMFSLDTAYLVHADLIVRQQKTTLRNGKIKSRQEDFG